MSKKPTVLMILDGYGLNERHDANAVYEANTPVMDKLMAEYPFVKGRRPYRIPGAYQNHQRDSGRRLLQK